MTDPAPTPEDAGPSPAYLDAETIAAELGVHIQTVQRYFREGLIPGRKIGKQWRTTRAAFDAWLTGGPVPGGRLEGTDSGITLEVKG